METSTLMNHMSEKKLEKLIMTIPSGRDWHSYIFELFKQYNITYTKPPYSELIWNSHHRESIIKDILRWKLLHS
jgi:hypothetical protein